MLPIIEIEFDEAEYTAMRDMLTDVAEFESNPRVHETWEQVMIILETAVAGKAPRWLMRLVASFDSEVGVFEDSITGVVFSDEVHAPFQERGTDAYWPNMEAIEEWSAAHGMDTYYVAKLIAERGVPAIKYAEESLVENAEMITDVLAAGIGRVMEQEY